MRKTTPAEAKDAVKASLPPRAVDDLMRAVALTGREVILLETPPGSSTYVPFVFASDHPDEERIIRLTDDYRQPDGTWILPEAVAWDGVISTPKTLRDYTPPR